MPSAATDRGETVCYVESSALLAALLEQDGAAKQVLRRAGKRVTSALTLTESHRAVLRARQSGRLTLAQSRRVTRALQTFARRCDVVAVSDEILARAGRPFLVEPVRTFDAIHLATIEVLGIPPALVTVLSRDERVRENATASGYVVV